MSKGKRHAAAADLYDRDHHHTGREALELVKSFPSDPSTVPTSSQLIVPEPPLSKSENASFTCS
ncbi:MAG: hypothetical protein CL442_01735, partial [Acidimicrobiaceae bacterium]|nr:hypothetical protein [Acidimicrobiaceae bacterium]